MISFKKANENDIEHIRKLAETSWKSAYAKILSRKQIDYMLSEMYSAEKISAQLMNPNYHYYLIFNEKISAGFIGFEFHYEKETTKLHRLYLLAEMKGKSLGKTAINFLKEKILETSDKRIILTVNKKNQAKEFYESQGFMVYGEGIFDIGNGFVMDDYLMEFCF
jgi:GNAT superfamily N-acetyltransferase